MTIVKLHPDAHPYVLNMSYPPSWQQDRWPQSDRSPDYATMGAMVYNDPHTHTLPSTTGMQRTTMAPPYSLPTTYAESPMTPMATSPYGSQGHYGDYQSNYSYPAPSVPTSYGDQMPLRHSQRPMAPPTPPLEADRSMPYNRPSPLPTVKSTVRRSPRRSVSVVKSEATNKPIKDCPKYRKTDGTLQYVSNEPVDVLLQKIEMVLPARKKDPEATTPESMASPARDQDRGRPQPKKEKQCPVCGKMVAQNAQLEVHMRAHTGVKPYKCDICGRCVSQPGNLQTHRRTHFKSKPYKCSFCPERFATNGGRKVHERTKHLGGVKHDCPIPKCDSTFTTIGNMKHHINKMHRPELEGYQKMLELHDPSQPFPEAEAKLWERLRDIYKNSNCGIKGRGRADDDMKMRDKLFKEELERSKAEKARKVAQGMPVSPDASPVPHHFRTQYDQQEEQHYAVRPHAAQHTQQGYLQQLPVQQTQTLYHGLPQPTPYNMPWSSSQYH